jgi:hypothetical protein
LRSYGWADSRRGLHLLQARFLLAHLEGISDTPEAGQHPCMPEILLAAEPALQAERRSVSASTTIIPRLLETKGWRVR